MKTSLVAKYFSTYAAIQKIGQGELRAAAGDYDKWFRGAFIKWLEAQITITKGRWTPEPESTQISKPLVEMLQEGVGRILLRPAVGWITTYFEEAYRGGLELADINLAFLEIDAEPRKLSKRDRAILGIIRQSEGNAWLQHCNRHCRTVERQVSWHLVRGSTTDSFLQAVTCPDGHILCTTMGATPDKKGGGQRVSWFEMARRFEVGRVKIMSQRGQEMHMLDYAEEAGLGRK